MPNKSEEIRHMTAIVHHVSWFHRPQTLCFQKGAEYVFDSNLLEANAQFTDVIPDYIFKLHFRIHNS